MPARPAASLPRSTSRSPFVSAASSPFTRSFTGPASGPATGSAVSLAASAATGAQLARLRRRRGLSQQQLADLLCAATGSASVTASEISRWERGTRRPSAPWQAWLAHLLALSSAPVPGRTRATRNAAPARHIPLPGLALRAGLAGSPSGRLETRGAAGGDVFGERCGGVARGRLEALFPRRERAL